MADGSDPRAHILERRKVVADATSAELFVPIRRIGGAEGWYYADALWRLRAGLDALLGGAGRWRGRRHSDELQVGDSIGSWRVEAFEPNRTLRLAATMKLPGQGWLQFDVASNGHGTTEVRQTATFVPRGWRGWLYWYALYPIHQAVFSGMLDAIASRARTGTGQKATLPTQSSPNGSGARNLPLEDGSRIAVLGGGPAGSFFSIFLLDMAERMGLDVGVDIYEPKNFAQQGPPGCNMCGGIISESLVQHLAAEGIRLPSTVVQRGIDSYTLHMDVGRVRIATPFDEKRIASVYRGLGPRNQDGTHWESFDAHLLGLAESRGARRIRRRIEKVRRVDGKPVIDDESGTPVAYDLLVVATGVNGGAPGLLEELALDYQPPRITKTVIREYLLGRETIRERLGSSMQVFLLNIPRLEFAAAIPKGDYVTVCLLGEEIDRELLGAFLGAPEVRACLPTGWNAEEFACKCAPKMNVGEARNACHDRVAFVGDAGVARLYKDGIGAAYRTSKAAAAAAVFHGVSREDLLRHYWPACRAIQDDNRLGHLLFAATSLVQKHRIARVAMRRVVAREQNDRRRAPRLSSILWDMFTGSAGYRQILIRALHPALLVRLGWELLRAPFERRVAQLEPEVQDTIAS